MLHMYVGSHPLNYDSSDKCYIVFSNTIPELREILFLGRSGFNDQKEQVGIMCYVVKVFLLFLRLSDKSISLVNDQFSMFKNPLQIQNKARRFEELKSKISAILTASNQE